MFSFLLESDFMTAFRTYWPIGLLVIGGYTWLFRYEMSRKTSRKLVSLEILENARRLNSVTRAAWLPENQDEFVDSVQALIPLRDLFSMRIYEQYLASLYLFRETESERIFKSYNGLQALIGAIKEASELLQKENRTEQESKALVRKSLAIGLLAIEVLLMHYSSLKALGFHSEVQSLERSRGKGIKHFRNVNAIFDETPELSNLSEIRVDP